VPGRPFDVDLTSNMEFCSIALETGGEADGKSVVAMKITVNWGKVLVSEVGPFQLAIITSHSQCREIIGALQLVTGGH